MKFGLYYRDTMEKQGNDAQYNTDTRQYDGVPDISPPTLREAEKIMQGELVLFGGSIRIPPSIQPGTLFDIKI